MKHHTFAITLHKFCMDQGSVWTLGRLVAAGWVPRPNNINHDTTISEETVVYMTKRLEGFRRVYNIKSTNSVPSTLTPQLYQPSVFLESSSPTVTDGHPGSSVGDWWSLFRTRFELRCFQLLSVRAWLPSAALSDNWYTRGSDVPFLSY